MAYIKDIRTKTFQDGYFEYTATTGSDIQMCEDKEALLQAFEGELKTRLGACSGIGLSNYGSLLYTFLGENLTEITQAEIVSAIQAVGDNYIEIREVQVNIKNVNLNRGQIQIEGIIMSIFGPINFKTQFTEKGCD
jgi:hypothetical protein